ncbi:MAG: hypothetical protein ABIO17_12250 [Pseudoxanthomonas sp.]
MRDMHAKKFEHCCVFLGFSHIADQLVFKSDDGLQVTAVLQSGGWNSTARIHRRATLEKLAAARKAHTEAQAAGETPAVMKKHPELRQRAAEASNEKATGAVTPMAS